jgi:hypothetical protein
MVSAISIPISDQTMDQLEATIEHGHRTFLEVCYALLEIRHRKLYRERQYNTFEEYCRERWGWSADYGYKMICSADVTQQLVDHDLPPPKNERQVRKLARIKDPEQRVDTWKHIGEQHGAQATTSDIQHEVDQRLGVDFSKKLEKRRQEERESQPFETLITDPQGERRKANMRHRYSQGRGRVRDLLDMKPGDWVPVFDEDDFKGTRDLIARMRQWCYAMEKEMGGIGIRLVAGNQPSVVKPAKSARMVTVRCRTHQCLHVAHRNSQHGDEAAPGAMDHHRHPVCRFQRME